MRKRLFSLVIACLVSCSFICMAQDLPKEGGKGPGQNVEQMVTELGLSDKQAKKFKAALEEMKPSQKDSGEKPSREEMEKKRSETDAKIKKVLTYEQYAKYQELQKKKKGGKKKSAD